MDNMLSNDLLDMEKMADDAASVGICGSDQQSLQAVNYTDPTSDSNVFGPQLVSVHSTTPYSDEKKFNAGGVIRVKHPMVWLQVLQAFPRG